MGGKSHHEGSAVWRTRSVKQAAVWKLDVTRGLTARMRALLWASGLLHRVCDNTDEPTMKVSQSH